MDQRPPDDVPKDDASSAPATPELQRAGVLVVDDDAEVVDTLAEALAAQGYRVLRARDGVRAMGVPSRVVPGFGPLSSIDVVITDLVMPGVSGLDLIGHVRKRDAFVPIIAISACGDEALRFQAIRLGASVVLHKPFTLDDLLRLVQRLAPTHCRG